MRPASETPIRDLAPIGDRRTAALVTSAGDVVWYCPGRFDRPSLLAALLDSQAGGGWTLHGPDLTPASRSYRGDSGVLDTRLTVAGASWSVTDFMPMDEDAPSGICRIFSAPSQSVTVTLQPAPDYARSPAELARAGDSTWTIGIGPGAAAQRLVASHPVREEGGRLLFELPRGESGWAALVPASWEGRIDSERVGAWLERTLAVWDEISGRTTYSGPYEAEVADSLRALRLLTHDETGGIVAAPTTSLPEVVGGERNYDYRYVWLRDAGMIASALIRAESDGTDERKYLSFVCNSRRDLGELPLAPFYTLDGDLAEGETSLDLSGWRGSRPVRIGNDAKAQLQLDALANVLLAAKLIYGHYDTREHWPVVVEVADYLVDHWQDTDYGIWEERDERQYTTGKVVVACGLDSIAEYADDPEQAARWRGAVADIRAWVDEHCITSAAVPGGDAVDVSAALYPVWNYVAPDSPEMLATMRELERQYGDGHLYRRHLERFDSHGEGAFLAGTFWVAQYWVMRRDFDRARAILDAGLEYANDLGLFAEEADPATGTMLGNFPQTFVHAAFIGAVIDLKTALEEG